MRGLAGGGRASVTPQQARDRQRGWLVAATVILVAKIVLALTAPAVADWLSAPTSCALGLAACFSLRWAGWRDGYRARQDEAAGTGWPA